MAEYRWDDREQVILEAIAKHEDETAKPVKHVEALAELAGLDRTQTLIATRALIDDDYLDATDVSSLDGDDFLQVGLAPRGRREVGQWPSDDPYETLVRLLESRIQSESDDDKRSKLQTFLRAVQDVGANTAGSVLAGMIQQMG